MNNIVQHEGILDKIYKPRRYSLCFVFNLDMSLVLLIKKDRPSWQAGKLNGIGGKMEDSDLNDWRITTSRELEEEAGIALATQHFNLVTVMTGINEMDEPFEVYVSAIAVHDDHFYRFEEVQRSANETEEIIVQRVSSIMMSEPKCLENLHMLIPMSLYVLKGFINPIPEIQYKELSK